MGNMKQKDTYQWGHLVMIYIYAFKAVGEIDLMRLLRMCSVGLFIKEQGDSVSNDLTVRVAS